MTRPICLVVFLLIGTGVLAQTDENLRITVLQRIWLLRLQHQVDALTQKKLDDLGTESPEDPADEDVDTSNNWDEPSDYDYNRLTSESIQVVLAAEDVDLKNCAFGGSSARFVSTAVCVRLNNLRRVLFSRYWPQPILYPLLSSQYKRQAQVAYRSLIEARSSGRDILYKFLKVTTNDESSSTYVSLEDQNTIVDQILQIESEIDRLERLID